MLPILFLTQKVPQNSSFLQLPYDFHSLWMQERNLYDLFPLRAVSRQFRDMIDAHLKSYFLSGPPLVAWFMNYNDYGVDNYDIRVSFIKKRIDAGVIHYHCYYFGHEGDNSIRFLQMLYSVRLRKAPEPTTINLNVCEAWITVRLLRLFDVVGVRHVNVVGRGGGVMYE